MKKTVFLFPGDGIHQKDMLHILRESEEFFCEFFQRYLPETEGIYSVPLMDETYDDLIIDQMRIVFSEIAIASFWRSKGVNPSAVVGHSLGEYAAACFAGILDIRQCMELICSRGTVLEKTYELFRMGVIHASLETVGKIISDTGNTAEISAVNGRKLVTVSGREADVKLLIDECERRNIKANLTAVHGGGHNSFLKNYCESFANETADKKFSEPKIHMIPTAHMCGVKSPSDGRYWLEQMLCPVDLMSAFNSPDVRSAEYLIDVGVSPALLGMAIEEFRGSEKRFIPSIRAGRNYRRQLENALDAAASYGLI